MPDMATKIFMAKVHHEEPVEGIVRIMLELIRDQDAIELVGGEEFVTVALQVDLFA